MNLPTRQIQELLLEIAAPEERRGQVFLIILRNGETLWGVYLGEIDGIPQFYLPSSHIPEGYGLDEDMVWICLEEAMMASTSGNAGVFALARILANIPASRHSALEAALGRIRKLSTVASPNLRPIPPASEVEARGVLNYPEEWPLCEDVIRGLELLFTLEHREVKASGRDWPADTASVSAAADLLVIAARRENPSPMEPSATPKAATTPVTLPVLVADPPPQRAPGTWRALLEDAIAAAKLTA